MVSCWFRRTTWGSAAFRCSVTFCRRVAGLSRFSELLGQLQALTLVGGTDTGAVQLIRLGGQPFVDEAADELPVAQCERYLERADLETRGDERCGKREKGVHDAGL